MSKDIFISLLFCLFLSSKIYAQELTVQFVAYPTAQSQVLNFSNKPQKFNNRAALAETISQEIERLQLLGFLGVRTQEKKYLNVEGQGIVEISFDLGPQWQYIVFSYPGAIEQYILTLTAKKSKSEIPILLEQSGTESSVLHQESRASSKLVKISVQEVPDFLNQLSKLMAQDFSPFSQLKFTDLKPIEFPVLFAELRAVLIPQRKIDSLVIKGYSEVDPGFLKHKSGLNFPFPFKEETINQAEEILSSSPYVGVQRPSETLFEKEKTTLYMYLEKKVANQVEGILGFGTDPESQSLKFNGYLNLQLWNNLNKSEQFDLRYKADGNQQERLEIQTGLPYIAQTPFGVQGRFELFRRDSTFTTATTGVQVTYNPFGPWALALGYTSMKSTKGSGVSLGENNISNYNQVLWGLEAQLTKERNSILMPRRYGIKLLTEFGSSEDTPVTGNPVLDSKQSFTRQRLNFEFSYLWNLWPNQFFWVNHKTAYLKGENLRINEFYRFGGTQSLRGFNENLLETSQLHLTQLEYRLSFSDTFYIHHLSDVAFYRNEIEGNMQHNFSLGLGIALVTRAGILKIQLAQGFGESSDFSRNNTKIHLVFNSQF